MHIASLIRMIRKEAPDVIQGWMYHANLLAAIAAPFSLRKTPVIWNIRQSLYSLDYEKRTTAAVIKAGAFTSRLSRHIVYNSVTAAVQHKQAGYCADRQIIIPNGFDTASFRPCRESYVSLREELNLRGNTPVIGLVGRFHPMKDHETFLRAASILHREFPSVHFVLVGKQVDSSNSILQKQISELHLSQNVHLLGERSDIRRITAAFDVATCSSFTEAFPNVVGEAMSCGVPCVATDVGDSAHVVGDTGRVIPARNPPALAQAWSELIEMESQQRTELGMRARQRVMERFSLETVVKSYENLYTNEAAFKINGSYPT